MKKYVNYGIFVLFLLGISILFFYSREGTNVLKTNSTDSQNKNQKNTKEPKRTKLYKSARVFINKAKQGEFEKVKLYIEKNIVKPDTNVAHPKYGRARLYAITAAAQNNHWDIVEYLVRNGAKIDVFSRDELSPLILAIRNQNLPIVKFLLANGANPNHKQYRYTTPLAEAVKKESFPIMKLLIKFGADIVPDYLHSSDQYALAVAAKYGYDEIVNYLTKKGANINIKGHYGGTPIHYAIKNKDLDMVKTLLKYNPDLSVVTNFDETGETREYDSLSLSIKIGSNEITNLLLSYLKQYHTNFNYNRALFEAINQNKPKLVGLLLERGADPHIRTSHYKTGGITTLMEAAATGNIEIAKILINAGVDTKPKDSKGKSAIGYAKRSEMIRYLIDKNVPYTYTDLFRWPTGKSKKRETILLNNITKVDEEFIMNATKHSDSELLKRIRSMNLKVNKELVDESIRKLSN